LDIKIDVKGLDAIQKGLKDLEHSVDPNTFNEWADRIARSAKLLCNDPNCKRIKIVKKGHLMRSKVIMIDLIAFEYRCVLSL